MNHITERPLIYNFQFFFGNTSFINVTLNSKDMLAMRKAAAFIIALLLVVNLVLFGFGRISPLIFWLSLGLLYGAYLIGVKRKSKAG